MSLSILGDQSFDTSIGHIVLYLNLLKYLSMLNNQFSTNSIGDIESITKKFFSSKKLTYRVDLINLNHFVINLSCFHCCSLILASFYFWDFILKRLMVWSHGGGGSFFFFFCALSGKTDSRDAIIMMFYLFTLLATS